MLQTLWGAFSSLWTPAIWLIRGISSLKVYRGGLVGSGKLVLLKGSVSSRNWTLHTNVAMVHPCKAGLDQRNSGCAAAASDRQAAPPGREQVPCSSKKKIPLVLDRLHSFYAAAKESGKTNAQPQQQRSGIPPVRAAWEWAGRTLRASDALRSNCRRDCNTWRLGWAMRRGSLLKRRRGRQTPARRSAARLRRARLRHLAAKRRSTGGCRWRWLSLSTIMFVIIPKWALIGGVGMSRQTFIFGG